MANILGAAGISPNDKVVIYGECMPCGGGPAPATYVYWIMKSLGHKNVRVLDGNIEDWVAAGLPTSNESKVRPCTNYIPEYTLDLSELTNTSRVAKAQLIDARKSQEFNVSSIPEAIINIPYDSVLDNHTIKNETALKNIFADLSKDKPVVAFTNTGIKASVLWFALELMGYDSKLYAYQDWLGGQTYEGNTSAQGESHQYGS
jgi:thiosulfate/3-mercaptopyruvate sulfurtransferase